MGVFDKILKDDETLFKNELALDSSFLPPIIKYREEQQQYIAQSIKPLFQKRTGKVLLIHGSPGIGKTAAVKHVLKELANETEEIFPIYVNCWKKNTGHKIITELCEILDMKFFQNLTPEQIFKKLASNLNKKPSVICLDEVDKLDNDDILYRLSEDIFKKTIVLITNDKNWITKLDQRVKSRLMPEIIEFNPYSMKETYEILKQRLNYAFYDNVFNEELLDPIAEKAFELKDIRTGIYLLKESGSVAEFKSSRVITEEHVQEALRKLNNLKVEKPKEVEKPNEKLISLIKNNLDKTTKELYEISGFKASYKTFRRKLIDLEKKGLIKLEIKNNSTGKTTEIKIPGNKTLDSY